MAVAAAAGVMPPESLQPLSSLVERTRIRSLYPEDVLVVALAGGTGSGKSSLLNALTGEELVPTGGMRPTTSEPAAAVPSSVGPRLDGFLDYIVVGQRHRYDGLPMCLIDLPDTDSVEAGHREEVDRLLPLVDLVVWVTDPEKYRDARLHHDYLGPLSGHSAQFVVVLNQIDRLDPTQLEQVRDDLATAMRDDGLTETPLVPIAAAPAAGPPFGIEDLVGVLEAMRASRKTVAENLATGIALTVDELVAEAGAGIDFDERAEDVLGDTAASLGARDVDGAISGLTSFLDGLAAEVGGPCGDRLSRLAADVPAHVRRVVGDMGRSEPRGWLRRRRRPEPFDGAGAAEELKMAVIRPARAVLAQRATALAAIADLAVEAESLRSRPSR